MYLSNFPKASFVYSGDKDTNNYPHYVVFRVKYSFFYVHFTLISLQISRKLMA
nr:MAG TPA: hypothetical protein [Caudoviricetes sp.]